MIVKFVEIPGGRLHELPRCWCTLRMRSRVGPRDGDGRTTGRPGRHPPQRVGSVRPSSEFGRRRMDLAVTSPSNISVRALHVKWATTSSNGSVSARSPSAIGPICVILLRTRPLAPRQPFQLRYAAGRQVGRDPRRRTREGRRPAPHVPSAAAVALLLDQFLLCLNSPVADTAYTTWAGAESRRDRTLPAKRFASTS